ncbi:hypothetical protein, partial [Trichloromonas sp.]|uniref:hypothetical protein n=1 Tax=Trichloromonas sp. TaxID=3069249 RepID=UPI002A3FDAC7|nr:hypothetical protein [Trichloromonas sp.]
AVQLTVPVIRVRRGLSPPSQRLTTTINHLVLTHHAPCLAHQKKAAPASAADEPKFLYVDAEGGLHFAATLAEIPAAFRKQAQRLEE